MDEKNRKIIAIISFVRKFISVFFNIFFDIYVLKLINDLGFIILINLISLVIGYALNTLIVKYMNNKIAKNVYITSFILLLFCIGLLLIFKEKIIQYILLYKILYRIQEGCYSAPLEMIIMGSNSHNTFSSFQANMNILAGLATIFTPIFSGFIIETFSYNILFIILGIETFIVIITSTRITSFYIKERKANVKEFWSKAKKYNHMKDIYKCMFYRRISVQGAITDLLPIILFLKLNSELSVGTYNSIFAILSIIALSLLKLVNKRNISKNFYIPFAILIFISTLILVFIPSFTILIIYYICMNTFAVIIESESCSAVYEAINTKELSIYSREHYIVYNIYMCIGQVISYSIAYILYRYFYNANILSIVISILTFFLVISCIYLQKTEEYLYNKKE